ncbi:MAG: hypothetical protein CM15mV13_3390 [uncultured marine virus]|nr:MAG: hypothetical protein CM15mV13_3390 [uncultured marine virus]
MLQGHLTVKTEQLQKSDYEYITKKVYPAARSVTVYGGERLQPPVYGKVYISIRTQSGALLNTTTKKESRLIYLNIPLQQSNLLLSIPLHSTLDLKLGRSLMVIKLHYLIMKLRLEFWGLSINTIVKRNQQGLTDVLTNLRINR